MARYCSCVFLIAFLVFSSFVFSIESRKMLEAADLHEEPKKVASTADDRLFKNALPKGTVPASSPSKRGHADTVDEKLAVARHLAASDRLLRSVPSPGIGN